MLITLVTGSPKKLAEVSAILGAENIQNAKLDLPEIQSMDLREIVLKKVREAFTAVGGPVMVDDISASVEGLRGFPGPFVKFWDQQVTWDHTLEELLQNEDSSRRMKITAMVAYKDAEQEIVVEEFVEGHLRPRTEGEGWGFDFFFVPDGYEQTYAQMGFDMKNKISHRSKAFLKLKQVLVDNGKII
jgi:non-canonical purine NTP pyrophosphatase (RdgB/HAM1 family)